MYPTKLTQKVWKKISKIKKEDWPTNTKVWIRWNQESFKDYDLWVGLGLCLLLVFLTGFPNIAQQPETFGEGGSIVGSTSTDLYGFGSGLCCCSAFSLSSSVLTGLSSPDKSLSSQTSPDEPDLLNDISDLGNASILMNDFLICFLFVFVREDLKVFCGYK